MAEARQHYLITGASGFIGHRLCEYLRAKDHPVIGLSRRPRRARRRGVGGVTWVEDLAQIPADQPVHAVVNLAGEPLLSGRWTRKRKQTFIDSRVHTTQALIAWMKTREPRPSVLVSGSAVGYYGDQQARILEETDDPRPGFSHTLCFEWEQSALQARDLGVRVCLLRTGIVLGREGGTLKSMLPAFRLGLGGRLGRGNQWLSWIHAHDLLRLIEFLVNHDTLTGPFNGTAPQPVTNRQFSEALAHQLRRPLLMPVPTPLLRLALGEVADELLLASQRVVPAAAMEAGFEFAYPELGGALRSVLG